MCYYGSKKPRTLKRELPGSEYKQLFGSGGERKTHFKQKETSNRTRVVGAMKNMRNEEHRETTCKNDKEKLSESLCRSELATT